MDIPSDILDLYSSTVSTIESRYSTAAIHEEPFKSISIEDKVFLSITTTAQDAQQIYQYALWTNKDRSERLDLYSSSVDNVIELLETMLQESETLVEYLSRQIRSSSERIVNSLGVLVNDLKLDQPLTPQLDALQVEVASLSELTPDEQSVCDKVLHALRRHYDQETSALSTTVALAEVPGAPSKTPPKAPKTSKAKKTKSPVEVPSSIAERDSRSTVTFANEALGNLLLSEDGTLPRIVEYSEEAIEALDLDREIIKRAIFDITGLWPYEVRKVYMPEIGGLNSMENLLEMLKYVLTH